MAVSANAWRNLELFPSAKINGKLGFATYFCGVTMIPRRDFLVGAIASSALAAAARADFSSDDEVRNMLRERIERAHQSVGIVAVSFDSAQEKIATYGRSGSAVAPVAA